MADVEKLVEAASRDLFGKAQLPTEEMLLTYIRSRAACICLIEAEAEQYTEEEILLAVKKIQTRHDTKMKMGALFDAETYKPWLADVRGGCDFFYWNRYEKHLKTKLTNNDIVDTLDKTTDKIIDHLGNPQEEGCWARRGLVVGHVQSGKTANYIGVMCKAADLGYKVIIVLGGLLNSLRNQTQRRIDSDFFGFCTKKKKEIGVAAFTPNSCRRPVSLTTAVSDFRKNTADQVPLNLQQLNEPVVLVLKKNVTTLKNLRDWLEAGNKKGLSNYPLLLIDDEADNASVNTNSEDKDPTSINIGIRKLLKMFPRSSYLGYTATPFANIFIDPDDEKDMVDGELYKDLFPKDFIVSLEPPDNYIGPSTVFGEDAPVDVLREIDDNTETLPLKHNKSFVPQELPSSLKYALACFFLVKTIREIDGQKKAHHSMMINVSRFTDVQERLKRLVSSHLKQYQQSIKNYAGLSSQKALKESPILRELKTVWEGEFKEYRSEFLQKKFSWEEIQAQLNSSISSIVVLSVNNKSTERLDYEDYPDGRSIIAIGGLGLSRGLTLEGLSVSYFLRNSIMYDTLLQMGRWFGYREGYNSLCRIFMQKTAISWYSHIADAMEELRRDFQRMESYGLTPMEFGLKVRSHPTALIVTARNKMRNASDFVARIDLNGRFVETSRLINEKEILATNGKIFENAINLANESSTPVADALGWLWKNVPIEIIEYVVSNFKNADDCLLTHKEPLQDYLSWLKTSKGLRVCDILLRGVKEGEPITIAGMSVIPVKRSLENSSLDDKRLTFIKRHITSRGDEAAGLTEQQICAIKAQYNEENISDSKFRQFKGEHGLPPLLILEFASVFASTKVLVETGKFKRKRVGDCKIVPAYGISFPGTPSDSRTPKRLTTYKVNRVWLMENAEWQDDTDEAVEVEV